MMAKYFFICVFIVCVFSGQAQTPQYYQSIDFTLTGNSLKQELADLISTTHSTLIEYTSSSSIDTWDVLKQSDLDLADTSNVLLIYGYDDNDQLFQNDRTRDKTLSCHTSLCDGLWNREHVFPKSLANPSLITNFPGPGTDVHNLRSCDYLMNSWRGSLKFGNQNGNAGLTSAGNWYPGDEWKGDVARIIMYMYLRYPSQCQPNDVGEGSSSYSDFGDIPDIFLEWNHQDPVDQYEIIRNDIIQINQGNRNPFIDNPFLATVIWNGPAANNPWGPLSYNSMSTNSGIKFYPNPVKNMLYYESESPDENFVIHLYDVFSNQQATFENSAIDMGKFSAGVYFLIISQGENKKAIKIIKE